MSARALRAPACAPVHGVCVHACACARAAGGLATSAAPQRLYARPITFARGMRRASPRALAHCPAALPACPRRYLDHLSDAVAMIMEACVLANVPREALLNPNDFRCAGRQACGTLWGTRYVCARACVHGVQVGEHACQPLAALHLPS